MVGLLVNVVSCSWLVSILQVIVVFPWMRLTSPLFEFLSAGQVMLGLLSGKETATLSLFFVSVFSRHWAFCWIKDGGYTSPFPTFSMVMIKEISFLPVGRWLREVI